MPRSRVTKLACASGYQLRHLGSRLGQGWCFKSCQGMGVEPYSDCSVRRHGRLPAFGDYTIQHPFYRDPPIRANFSASIRYTTPTEFFVLRGEGVFNERSAGFSQWPAHAMMLMESPEYLGDSFSDGDRYIAERAADPEHTGSASTWLQAGINHHMSLAAQQVAGLLEIQTAGRVPDLGVAAAGRDAPRATR